MRIGKLHCGGDRWVDATVAFMKSGGYSVSKQIPDINVPTLVLWGRQDEILEPSCAERFEREIPGSRLVWVEDCGHVAHLEQPQFAAETLLAFAREE